MYQTVGPRGEVVIPAEIREQLGIEPGDVVTCWREADRIVIGRERPSSPLKGRFTGGSLTGSLERERAADRRRECDR
jgi:AbrB family looped-hinge helix DNA binding protein